MRKVVSQATNTSLNSSHCRKIGDIAIDYIRQANNKAIEKRVIRCIRNIDGGIRKTDRPLRNIDRPIRKTEGGYSENCEDNNTLSINTISNTRDIRDIVEQSPTTPIPYNEIIDYLNQKTGKNFKSSSKATQRHIKARFADGFTLNDFKQVIDTKSAQWLKDKKMSAYLRPDTLFGTKFEGYLNETNVKPKQNTSFSESIGLKVW